MNLYKAAKKKRLIDEFGQETYDKYEKRYEKINNATNEDWKKYREIEAKDERPNLGLVIHVMIKEKENSFIEKVKLMYKLYAFNSR